jgi:L-serine dehydratase
MSISVLDLFTIGIGPSSSHTVGPMRAARRFVEGLLQAGLLAGVTRIEAHLYGALALTGRGHGADRAILLGLEGEAPERVDVTALPQRVAQIRATHRLQAAGRYPLDFDEGTDLVFHRDESLPVHPNGLRFAARNAAGTLVAETTCYSVGGGFVVDAADAMAPRRPAEHLPLPYPYRTGDDLLRLAGESGCTVSEMTLRNEAAWRPEADTRARLCQVWQAMNNCVETGCRQEGVLPGALRVTRRAPRMYRELTERPEINLRDPLVIMDWVSLWAMAVNEENAAGGRVVTAPTNGAAGVIPAVLLYLARVRGAPEDQILRFLLTAGAIGLLYKLNASISGAEVGCQGEVGVACSMAAAALTEALGGTVPQVENAAEIGMEHNLGLTCDPVGGLVQVPCIERNAMAAVKAINAARLALAGDGSHRVSLDKVIATMRQTGADMSLKYKETARGGLAVNVIEC